ncbi:MAG TPA: DUF4249 family protein [Prolixibacteraceae bacterium]|nr:DUF4249 family protein [Prolixibacteraceae bacterium]
MKIKFTHILIIITLALLTYGCEDFFVPEIEQTPRSLVVEAILTDEPGYCDVKLSRTSEFSDRSYYYGERGAEVYIWSQIGESFGFTEISSGVYRSNDSITTQPGLNYLLYIKTKDGNTFMSEPQKMQEKCDIEEIVLRDSVMREVNYNYWGEPYVRDFEGISFNVKPALPKKPDAGFIYQWGSLINYLVFSSEPPAEFYYYCWKLYNNRTFFVYDYYQDLSEQSMILDDLHFMSYYTISPEPLDSSRFEGTVQSAISYSIYYKLKQYTINTEAAKFWRSVKRQGEASGKLFDPLEEEIGSNIYCQTDSSICAYGFFNTASVTEKIVKVKLGTREIRSVEMGDTFPVVDNTEGCLNQPTDFWINY